jgi:hypothetical protein
MLGNAIMTNPTARLNSLLWVALADPPRCGYWLARVRVGPGKYGPLCPAAIVIEHTTVDPSDEQNLMDRSPFYAAYLAGQVVSVWTLLQRAHTEPERFVRLEQEIDEAEYRYRLAEMHWANEHRPDEPAGRPKRAVDWMNAAPTF